MLHLFNSIRSLLYGRADRKSRDMITISTRSGIVLIIFNTLLLVFAMVCFSMHFLDRSSPAWKGGSGLPKMHVEYFRQMQRAHRRNRLLTKDTVACGYNNTMTMFILSDGVNRERRTSLRKLYKGSDSVRNFCVKFFFVIYGEVQKSEKSLNDYILISSYVQGYVEPQKIHFTYKSKPKAELKLKTALGVLQDPTSSESSSEETTEDESEETVEETIEEDDTKRKNRAVITNTTLSALSVSRDVNEKHSTRRPAIAAKKTTSENITELLQSLSTPRDVAGPNVMKQVTQPTIDDELPSEYQLRSRRDSPPDEGKTILEGIADGVKNFFGAAPTTVQPTFVEDEDEEFVRQNVFEKEYKPPVTLFATRCDGYKCVPVEVLDICNCTEKLNKDRILPDKTSRMNSMISISKIHDNRMLEEASSNSRWKIFVQDQQPVELTSLVAHLNHEAKVLAKLDACCSSLDGCPGCNHMFRQKLLLSTKLVPTISTKDTYQIEDDVRKILWNNPNDIILEFHVEPRGRKATRYWKVFNM